MTFVEKTNDVDRSTLYRSFSNFTCRRRKFRVFWKSSTHPKYFLSFVDLLTSKVYVYPMKSTKSILNKIEIFYKVVENKRKGQKIRLQTDEGLLKKIFDLNKKNNVDMFSTTVRGGKAFAAEKN